MSTFGGFGGFGQNNTNQQQQSSGFGGFGSNTNTSSTPAFGASNTGGFGASNTTSGGGLFGNTGGGFGGSGGAFGSSNTTSAFGSKPAFGASTTAPSGGLFGSSNTTGTGGGFGGFGGTSTANTGTTSTFGGSGGGLFGGAAKPAFGAPAATTGGSIFGGGTTGGFGATNNPGIGVNIGDPPGTGGTPFQPHTERETSSNQQTAYHNILFQDPYKKWSAEELRLVDYAQGRRHGNATGAGAFGVSSGFGAGSGFGTGTQQSQQSGGFGSTTGGGLFGSGSTTTTSGFGTQANTGTSGFGSGGGGLFGQNKPAATGGGLFGSTPAQPAQSGNLFGGTTGGGAFGSTGTTGGFGSTATTGTGGNLFGGASANKPAGGGFSFGNTAGTTPSTGFGSTGTGGFGANTSTTTPATGGGLFGSATPQASGTTSLFGGGAQQQQPSGSTFGSGFGAQTQQKPAGGLFGTPAATTSSGGLFGTPGNQSTGFGASGGAASTSNPFGAKPATASGTGLFGTPSTNQTTGTGLFGNTQSAQQQTGQGSIFGQSQNKPSLFGGSTQQQSGGGLFGGQPAQQQPSIFGASGQQQQQPQQAQSLFGSILGGSQGGSATPQSLSASITDVSAYGSASLFSNQGAAEAANPGPLATPLSAKVKPKRGSILPMYKLNPASARYVTPQKRGFGFSYSTYGTPGSASSTGSTPGNLGRSLLGASLNRGLNKSVSTSSLRRTFNAEDSILAPGAFSPSGSARFYGSNSGAKKLVINKDLRSDLFATPTKDRPLLEASNGSSRKLAKRVSFDTSTADHNGGSQGSTPVALSTETNGERAAADSTPSNSIPEMEQVRGNELTVVREESSSPEVTRSQAGAGDQTPGDYWMRPTKEEILNMNRMQRQNVANFTVGRRNVGQVAFKAPVDLSNIDLDDLFGGIVVFETRSATVYPVQAKKPPVGKGLNVPALISLEHSWPRGRDKRVSTDEKVFNKHIQRLKRVEDTTFESYDKDTGVWTFSVEHFTTYGLDYDEDESEDESTVADPRALVEDDAQSSPAESEDMGDVDDTFDFRTNPRLVPGAFDRTYAALVGDHNDNNDEPSFLGGSSAGLAPKNLTLSIEQPQAGDEYETSENEDMTSASLGLHPAAEQDGYSFQDEDALQISETPGGILRARMRAIKDSSAPMRVQVADGDDWMDMLQKTVSPQKRDRAMLRDLRDSVAQQPPDSPSAAIAEKRALSQPMADGGRGFATSIDLMNSLFERSKSPTKADRGTNPPKGFLKWPYERQAKIVETEDSAMKAPRPSWGPDGTLVLPSLPSLSASVSRSQLGQPAQDMLVLKKRRLQEDMPPVVTAKFSNECSADALPAQMRLTRFSEVDGVPKASLHAPKLASVFQNRSKSDSSVKHEKLVWELASILFDDIPAEDEQTEQQTRRAQLTSFWRDLVADTTSQSVGLAKSNEEKALASLAGHRVVEACNYLLQGKNFHLMALIARIGTDEASKKMMKRQLQEWYDTNFLSEFSHPVRAMYEMLAGNVCLCTGKANVPVEDRVEEFVISEEFQLTWAQAFGLRLWYAITPQDDISAAVQGFKNDVAHSREVAPRTWFAEQSIEPLWDDPRPETREDLLWGLLRLYAEKNYDLEAAVRPENSQLSPLDYRLSWQLGQALSATNKVRYTDNAADKSDATTYAFAAQLVGEDSFIEATFVLLHLSDSKARERALREHMYRHGELFNNQNGELLNTLTTTFGIPAAWLWEARALYMRGVDGDACIEVQCLVSAGLLGEAHRRLVEEVAPRAVVERDWTRLAGVLTKFEGKEAEVADWELGGGVYCDFLALKKLVQRREAVPSVLLQKLVASLPALQDSPHASASPMMYTAAVAEMSSVVARAIADSAADEKSLHAKVLSLPLTEDSHLAHSVDLSLSYYKTLMAR